MKQRLKMMITLFGLSIGFVMFGTAQAASAANYTVDTTVDDAALSACTAAANDCSLRGAINNANALAFQCKISKFKRTLRGVGWRFR